MEDGKREVKCAECGFLTVKKRTANVYFEMDEHYRKTGQAEGDAGKSSYAGAVCFAMERHIADEVKESEVKEEPKRSLAVITKPRTCKGFFPWKMGFDPKEHIEIMWVSQQREEIEARRLADEKRAEDYKIAEAKRTESAKIAEDKRDEERKLSDRRWSIGQGIAIAILGAGLAGVIAILVEPWKERAKQSVQPTAPAQEAVEPAK